MELKKKNEDHCKVSFLNVSIEVLNRKFTTELLDNSDGFLFISVACLIWIAVYHQNILCVSRF